MARRVGAVNTIRVDRRTLDRAATPTSAGFLQPLRDRASLAGRRASRCSAPAASARAVRWRSSSSGARVTVHARNAARGAKRSRRSSARGRAAAAGAGQLGSAGQLHAGRHASATSTQTPLTAAALTGRLVYDLVYNPPATRLLREAAAAGCQTIGGLDMLVARRSEQFEWWTGVAAAGRTSCGQAALEAARGVHARMKITSFEEFKELARRGTFVPVCKEIVADLLTPVSAFLKIAEHADYAFLLESVEGGEHVGRYSFLGKDPFLILRARDGKTTIERGGADDRERAAVRRHAAQADGRLPVAVRARICRASPAARSAISATAPRPGSSRCSAIWAPSDDGADAGRLHAVRHGAGVRSRAAPDPDHRQRAHHGRRRPRVAVSVRVREDRVPRARARAQPVARAPRAGRRRSTCTSNYTRERFEEQVRTAKEHIAAGDIYQVVLSQRFEAEVAADPFTVYRALRHVNPSPYMYFIRMGGVSVVGSSPEMLVRVEGSRVETHPIAGTRPRGRNDEEDMRLGRGAEAQREGARRARDARRSRAQRRRPRLRVRIGARAAVHGARALLARHAPDVDRRRASWPTIAIGSTRWCRVFRPARCRARRRCARCRSSASSSRRAAASTPARSATSISPATSISASRSAPSSCRAGKAYVQAGAGIVMDSNPAAEYEETRDKARALLRALELAQAGLDCSNGSGC